MSDKTRAKAEAAGVSTVGALVVAHQFRDRQDCYLLVFPDRVDLVRSRQIGAFLGGNAGVESYPIESVSSVSIRQSGIWSILMLTGANFDLEFHGDMETVPAARNAIMTAKSAA